MKPLLVRIEGLELAYRCGPIVTPAVAPLSFDIREGETLGLVGESGAGKSTLALEILGLLKYKGGVRLRGEVRYSIRPGEIAYIPQDPLASLDPLFSIGSQLREIHKDSQVIQEALKRVHLGLEKISLKSYPHELSGGMRQKVLIAMALLRNPKLVVADEPTSSLDTTTQAEILDLFRQIKTSGVAFLFVTHQIPLVKSFCDRVIIMKQGSVVEEGIPEEIFKCPSDPYTQTLVQSVPKLDFT